MYIYDRYFVNLTITYSVNFNASIVDVFNIHLIQNNLVRSKAACSKSFDRESPYQKVLKILQ